MRGTARLHGSERTVRGYVHQQRRQLGLCGREVFIPQSDDWGVEAQVDFHEPACTVKLFFVLFSFFP
jgi:hypothetical protein